MSFIASLPTLSQAQRFSQDLPQPQPKGPVLGAPMPGANGSVLAPVGAFFHSVQFASHSAPSTAMPERFIPEKPFPFGTAGFRPGRAITANEVSAVMHAAADTVWSNHSSEEKPLVIVGRDTRESSREHLKSVIDLLTGRGLDVITVEGPVSTPVASYMATHSRDLDAHGREAAMTILLTASHNPYQEGGIKILGPDGVNAAKSITEAIERYQTQPADLPNAEPGKVTTVDVNDQYFKLLDALIPPEELNNLAIGLDVHYGAGAPFADYLKSRGVAVESMRAEDPPKGYNSNSEPTKDNLAALSEHVTSQGKDMGVALDGDGDRFAAVDENGKLISVTDQLALALSYLAKTRGLQGTVGRSQATSHYLDELYANLVGPNLVGQGAEMKETPVGFKWFGPLFNNPAEKVLLAMESSGGANSGYNSTTEKDGIFMDMATLAAAAQGKKHGKSVREMITDLRNSVEGKYSFAEYAVDDVDKDAIVKAFESLRADGGTLGFDVDAALSQQKAEKLMAANNTNNTDGVKLYFTNGSWLLARPSGTENKLRVYVEGKSTTTQADADAARDTIWNAVKELLVKDYGVDAKNMKNKSAD